LIDDLSECNLIRECRFWNVNGQQNVRASISFVANACRHDEDHLDQQLPPWRMSLHGWLSCSEATMRDYVGREAHFQRDKRPCFLRLLSPKTAFLLVSFSLGELGDGLNIFQGIYLVGIGWNEASVGLALSLMGLTALLMQPWAGDWVDKTSIDRRVFLTVASILTAVSASTILLVHEGNRDHMLIFLTKIMEGISSSFIGPCLAALTLANFGPNHFDAIMASNILWGHVGSVLAAIAAGLVAYLMYPDIKFCFLVIGASALLAVIFVQYLPEGDPLMGRGFLGKVAMDENGQIEQLESDESTVAVDNQTKRQPPQASAYLDVFLDVKTCILCLTGFFFQYVQLH
jgi:MFS family permease